ncbi:hypothetical protein [Streptomyces albireticuli]|nr:hypothetical protein [Streptomyces albireticuli]MCD9145786.1 hypothetical protein [Streptomyces albireticuli]MCD9165863.1 hypothetical protein [Streptomyces albireticuli]MCD9194458.1 hypothetical protein [Streptomyces albireticuli]
MADEQDPTVEAAPDWHRPRASTVPVEPPRWDGQPQEMATGDPLDVQDWDDRLWRRV